MARMALLALLLLLPGGVAFGKSGTIYTPEEIRETLSVRLSTDEVSTLMIPFEGDQEISRLATKLTQNARNEHQKLKSLLAYFRKQGFYEKYDKSRTRTAREVMTDGIGNCLSYANLFVAMARAVGLEAVYLDASQVHSDFGRAGRVLVDYKHIMVGIKIGADLIPVDFDGHARKFNRYQIISDLHATADFYNNLGFERSYVEQNQKGFAANEVAGAFDLATRIWPGFARAWNNLGVAFIRSGRTKQGLLAYLKAIKADKQLAAPYFNLGQVYARGGKIDQAISAFKRAVALDPENAHYLYFLGKNLARQGNLEEALTQLEKGAKLDAGFFLIHMKMADIYYELQACNRARQSASRVLEIVPGHRDASQLMKKLHKICGQAG
ncbi:MAG: tetratricopeptide repeat protein [Deltaproteobacteria bacterium]|nr:tetratricopeptide repeat protein [Deltaproteobacteria bacterium]